MAKPKNPTDAIGERLRAHVKLATRAKDRISPNKPDQEANGTTRPYVYFFKIGGGGNTDLDGASHLQSYTYRVAVLASRDEEAEELLGYAREALVGDRAQGIPPWRDLANGIHGCFPADDADADTDDDGEQFSGQSFRLWFSP